MTATSFIICRLRLPEVAFETLVTVPIYILGQIPQHHITQIMELFPGVNVFQLLVPGGQVMEFKREPADAPPAGSPKDKTKSKDGIILQG